MPESENQLSLLGEIDELDLNSINKQLDALSDDDHQWSILRWPERLQTLYAVVLRQLQGLTFDDNHKHRLAVSIITAQAHYLGGRELYLPTNKTLKEALRDLDIFNCWQGNNIPQLAREHNLTERAIYDILAKQRKIQLKRRQKSLF